MVKKVTESGIFLDEKLRYWMIERGVVMKIKGRNNENMIKRKR